MIIYVMFRALVIYINEAFVTNSAGMNLSLFKESQKRSLVN